MTETMNKGLLYLMMSLVITLLFNIFPFEFLPIFGLLFQIMGINQLIRGSESKTDFKLARWGIIGSFAAIIFTSFYTAQLIMPYLDQELAAEEIVTILADNSGVFIMIIVSGIISSSVEFFTLQGLETYTEENQSLSNQFSIMKKVVIAGVIFSLLSNFISIFQILTLGLSIGTMMVTFYLYWQTRKKFVPSLSESNDA